MDGGLGKRAEVPRGSAVVAAGAERGAAAGGAPSGAICSREWLSSGLTPGAG